jgi:hypothetical protein
VAEAGSLLVRPLVVLLADAQAGRCGSGFRLRDALDSAQSSSAAGAAAALRALAGAGEALAARVNSELALQMWLGRRVVLPTAVEGGAPPATPGSRQTGGREL